MTTAETTRVATAAKRLAPIVRVRRWASLVTLPGIVLIVVALGVEEGVALMLADLVLTGTIAAVVLLRLEPRRREVVLDFVLHPVARKLAVAEARLIGTLPLLALRALRGRRSGEFEYRNAARGELALLALVPAAIVEVAVAELLLPAGWVTVRVVVAVMSVYGLLCVVGLAAGALAYPHRIVGDVLELRLGALYRVRVPLASILAVEPAPGQPARRSALVAFDGEVALAAAGRVDVRLVLDTPAHVERPVGAPVVVDRLSVAVDDPDSLRHSLGKR